MAVVAKISGTPLSKATDEQLEVAWSKISFLLGIKVAPIDKDAHEDELFVTSEWVREQYENRLTLEEMVQAYNMACNNQLGIKELFSILSPKHVGIVLDAYLRYMAGSIEINKVFLRQQLLPAPGEKTDNEISAAMESFLREAIDQVAAGKVYSDPGNGLFEWLVSQKRIVITVEDVDKYRALAADQLAPAIGSVKSRHARTGAPLCDIIRLVEQPLPQDYESRLKASAKRLYLNDYLKACHEETDE